MRFVIEVMFQLMNISAKTGRNSFISLENLILNNITIGFAKNYANERLFFERKNSIQLSSRL